VDHINGCYCDLWPAEGCHIDDLFILDHDDNIHFPIVNWQDDDDGYAHYHNMTTPILVRSIMHGVVITILLCCRSHWHLLSQPVDCLSLSS
jgi:hypothetical protein